ncbi:MAG: cephalosporin hydroxylase family protein [Thaumarchaeota archaeon]|nr:cephalosporin hydroxylase family protein [Nitrososphaerota archaeon]
MAWVKNTAKYKYSYHFTWLGRPFIQFPQDMVVLQEIIWKVKPDLIIETGIAHGGGLIFYASMLDLLGLDGKVLGIDIEIRPHNKDAILKHPMFKHIMMIEGSSVDKTVISRVHELAKNKGRVMVILDSSHTSNHVLAELRAYSPLVRSGSYVVVLDTLVEELPDDFFPDRPWRKGNSPKTAVSKFLKNNKRFVVDKSIEDKLLITVAPGGFLKCVKDP